MIDIKSEFIRLSDNEPMVLKVSALTDFLWSDYVRDAAPRVKYLTSHYDIRKLSRFGKELFEALYQGENLNPVISLQDAEDYFRAKQDGEAQEAPANYKPENAFWIGLLQDVMNSPGWATVSPVCYGNQFNSGNNSISILNKLSEVLDQAINNRQLDPTGLGEAVDELNELRKQFVEAKKAGDFQKAKEVREMGKELGKHIEEYHQQMREQMRPEIQDAVDKAAQEAQEISKALSHLSGDQEGSHKRKSVEEKQQLASRLRDNKKLIALANRLGALRRAWNQRKRARRGKAAYSDIVGVKFADSVAQAFPTELALAATPEGQALFALKYSQKTILCKDYEANVKNLDKGPIMIFVDISGSMNGESELWSKSMALVVAEEAIKQKRSVHIALFDTKIINSFSFEPNNANKDELLDFCLSWECNGGTSFPAVLNYAMQNLTTDSRADILLITDGQDFVSDELSKDFREWKDQTGVEMNCFCIGEMSTTLLSFADDVQEIDVHNDASSSDLFQNVLL
tara:strand:- start:3139 stop:4680 length:1542 start_codon:yes stop_codon:yes gene_type:complete